jgi:hypothetical protein
MNLPERQPGRPSRPGTLIARQDKAIPPEADRFTAQRRNADTREVDSSHLAITSQPDNVTDMIIDAVRCCRVWRWRRSPAVRRRRG